MRHGYYTDIGIVLGSKLLGEADRIVSIYTRDHGRVRAVAKGVRRTKSRFGGRLDMFTVGDFQFYSGRELDGVDQVTVLDSFSNLRADYPAFTAACAMVDAIEKTTLERESSPHMFAMLREGLRVLDTHQGSTDLLAYAFLAKAAAMAGMQATLHECAECSSPEVTAFSYSCGGTVCQTHTRPTDLFVSTPAVALWQQIVSSKFSDLDVLTVDGHVAAELGSVLVGFVTWQADSRLRAFGVMSRK